MQHHNIVLYTSEREDSELLIKVLIEHFGKVLVVTALQELELQLKDETAKIILIDSAAFQKSLMIYYSSLQPLSVEQACEHFIVTVVSAREENEAYEAYRNNIIDDYIITNPLYEKKRAIVVCSGLLKKLGVSQKENEALEYIYQKESFAQETKEVVLHGLELKEKYRLSFESSITEVENSINKATEQIKQHHNVNLDLDVVKNILASIRSDEIRPRLVGLQSKALDLLSEIISDVENITKKTDKSKQAELSSQAKSVTPFNKLYNANDEDAVKELDKIKEQSKAATPRILLVEDDPISIHLSITILHKFKLDVETATTGRRALVCLNNVKFDIVLLDVNLPDSNGLYLLGQIMQSSGKNSDTPIIMLTGNKNKQTVKKAIELGAKGYLIKPLSQGVIVKLFKKFGIS